MEPTTALETEANEFASATDAESGTSGTQSLETTSLDATSLVEEDLLVEEISIDGMCGVY